MNALVACDDAVLTDCDPNILARIWEPDVHLAIWRRSLTAELQLSVLDWEEIDDIDESVSRETLSAEIPALLEAAGYDGMAAALARDIVPLCERFSGIMDCAHMQVRLEVIETDACRKFHADNVAVRLLMPLVGPGTQWIHANGDGLIHDLRPGEVGLFKGWQWTDNPRILHRSPPIVATGETRLLFALTPMSRPTSPYS
ncbi:hypothetical protein J2W40_001619 [Sphingobium xenophagum]|uniref:DUF1826 domain-containing protein n=1 Tax=Sphingobium xenophagum TaxID=121428 RepID=A0ABU1WZU1_SPHXE|nr:DUF1826 domain-containing protein [Sphingobium xenophagum]MDR7154804.1 hypothetical protein [Sphingobium xenophagum]